MNASVFCEMTDAITTCEIQGAAKPRQKVFGADVYGEQVNRRGIGKSEEHPSIFIVQSTSTVSQRRTLIGYGFGLDRKA